MRTLTAAVLATDGVALDAQAIVDDHPTTGVGAELLTRRDGLGRTAWPDTTLLEASIEHDWIGRDSAGSVSFSHSTLSFERAPDEQLLGEDELSTDAIETALRRPFGSYRLGVDATASYAEGHHAAWRRFDLDASAFVDLRNAHSDGWILVGEGGTQRLLPQLPPVLVGAGYVVRRPTLTVMAGLPVALVDWTPRDDVCVHAAVADDVEIAVTGKHHGWSLTAIAEWTPRFYRGTDGARPDLWTYQSATAGLDVGWSAGPLRLSLDGGLVLWRRLADDQRPNEAIALGTGWYAGASITIGR